MTGISSRDDDSLTPLENTVVEVTRETQASTPPRRFVPRTADSDPPTVLVRRDSFRELPPGTVVGDTYEVDARIGAGAMGEVYAARHVKLGKRVAVKVIGRRLSEDDAAIERFAMEARTLAQVQHPAIVAVDHVGELADGRAYFVMEFLRGESLFERLQRGRMPLPEALRVLDQMARGLEAAHGEGVIHRDLKPENTFLVHLPGEPPAVKLVDFGLAKLRHADADFRAERTQSGVAVGTPMYMSPEQARGPDVDHRTDIYALGVVAYELVLGQTPFPHARTAPELFAAHLHEAPPLPRSIWPEIPPPLDLALFAMLAKDPAHRPTLAQVRAVIAASRNGTEKGPAATEFVRPRSLRRWRSAATAVVGGLIAALAAGITIGVSVGPGPGPEETEAEVVAPTLPRDRTKPHERPEEKAAAPEAAPSPTPRPEPVPSVPKPSPAPQKPRSVRAARLPARPANPPVVPPTAVFADAPGEAPPLDRNQTINPFKSKANP